jgi:hypothetical protein
VRKGRERCEGGMTCERKKGFTREKKKKEEEGKMWIERNLRESSRKRVGKERRE